MVLKKFLKSFTIMVQKRFHNDVANTVLKGFRNDGLNRFYSDGTKTA